jgi:hypothetical protein
MSSDVNVVSFAQRKLRVIRARTGSAIPFESARVIFAGDGAHLCTLPLHGARIYQGWTENPRTRQLERNGDAARRVDRRKARDHVSRSEVCASAFPFLVQDACDPRDRRTRKARVLAWLACASVQRVADEAPNSPEVAFDVDESSGPTVLHTAARR